MYNKYIYKGLAIYLVMQCSYVLCGCLLLIYREPNSFGGGVLNCSSELPWLIGDLNLDFLSPTLTLYQRVFASVGRVERLKSMGHMLVIILLMLNLVSI